MPKANKKAQCEPHTSDTVPPEEETNLSKGQKVSKKCLQDNTKPHNYICTLHRRS